MPTHSAVVRLNLEFYRKQAKALLKTSLAGDSAAAQRLLRYVPQLSQPAAGPPALHDAQLAVAREQGFPNWPRFKAFIVESRLNFQELVASFIDAAVSDEQRANAILAEHPKVAGAGLYVALVLGDWKQVDRTLSENPALVQEKSGPQNCEPLLYVCFSRYANGRSERAADLAETARVLLRHGADPNTSFISDDLPDNPLPCLYAATGLNNNPALASVLLEAGANPNDTESLYHSTEHPDLACMKLLLRYGAKPAGKNAVKHMLDREDTEGLRILLAAGADPNEGNERDETALHWAVWRGRSPAIVSALLDHHADVNAQRKDGRTAYAMAVMSGQTEIAALLEARGAKTDLSLLDRFVGACASASPTELERLLAERPEFIASPGIQHLLPDFASGHHTGSVRALLAAGVAVDARGDLGGTALHWACWKGYADLVQLLIDHGASMSIEDTQFHAPPPGWLHHGSTNCHESDGDHAQVARVLLAAGAPLQPLSTPTGNPAVDDVLREHKLIE